MGDFGADLLLRLQCCLVSQRPTHEGGSFAGDCQIQMPYLFTDGQADYTDGGLLRDAMPTSKSRGTTKQHFRKVPLSNKCLPLPPVVGLPPGYS